MVAPVYITWGTGMPRVPTAKAGVLELGHMNKRVIMFSSVTVFDCATHATPCIQALTQHDYLARACTVSCSLLWCFFRVGIHAHTLCTCKRTFASPNCTHVAAAIA